MRLMAVLSGLVAVMSLATTVPQMKALVATKMSAPTVSLREVPRSSPAWHDRVTADPDDVLFDLDGREINRAVARYSIGRQGAVYELHAPRTEVTRLGSPSS